MIMILFSFSDSSQILLNIYSTFVILLISILSDKIVSISDDNHAERISHMDIRYMIRSVSADDHK